MGIRALAGGRCISGLYSPREILIPSQDGSCHLQEQASWGRFLSDQRRCNIPSRAGMATDARDILPTAELITQSPAPALGSHRLLPRRPPVRLLDPSIPSPALPAFPLPRTHAPHARSSLKCTKLQTLNE